MAYTTLVGGTTITAAWGNASVRDQTISPFSDASARSTAITAPVEGMVSHLNGVNTLGVYSGSVWSTIGPVHGALTNFTPAITQGGAVTATVAYARYQRIGRMILGSLFLSVTGSGTASNSIVVTLPVTAITADVTAGSFSLFDTGTGVWHTGSVYLVFTSSMAFIRNASGGATFLMGGGTSGYTDGLVAGDKIYAMFQYEAATDA